MGIEVIGAALGGGGGKVLKVDRITSTTTWTAPSDVYTVEVFLVGGGGAGRSVPSNLNNTNSLWGSGGGAGGQVIEQYLSVTPGQTYTITIGSGGSAGSNLGSSSNPGSSTTFGNLLTAVGGSVFSGESGQTIAGNAGSDASTTIASNSPSADSSGGGGGGAGSAAIGYYNPNSISYFEEQYKPNITGFSGGSGGSTTRNASRGGFGVKGRGGGGGGGIGFGPGYFIGHDGGGSGAHVWSGGRASSAGTINQGGGGGAGAFYSGTWRPSSSGGSGYAEIRYWTAG